MKKIFLILAIVFCIMACKAQQPIAKIAGDKVKVNNKSYILKRPNDKVTEIINSDNKLKNVKQVAPNIPSDLKLPAYTKVDEKLIAKICADVIPLSKLQKLPKGYGDFLFIDIKVNTQGEPLEMEFLVRNTSLISLNEIEQIELEIKKKFKVTFKQGIEKYFSGANYFNLYIPIAYNEMLKAKENK